jgi:uncharacterized protein with HEPN domain
MSSKREPRVYLWDARAAAEAVLRFARGKSFDDLLKDDLLRSAIERQLQIVGEALSQLARADAEIAGRIPLLRQIIAFRNILVHGYDSIDYENVWQVIQKDVPDLISTLSSLLGPDGGAEEPRR